MRELQNIYSIKHTKNVTDIRVLVFVNENKSHGMIVPRRGTLYTKFRDIMHAETLRKLFLLPYITFLSRIKSYVDEVI